MVEAGAGSRPGGRGTFLCFAKEKYPKERRPAVCVPHAFASGQPAVLGPSGVSPKLAALRQRRALIRSALRSSAQPDGGGQPGMPMTNTSTGTKKTHTVGLPVSVAVSAVWNWLFGCLDPPHLYAPALCSFGRIKGRRCLSRRRVHGGPRPKLCSAGRPGAKRRGRRQLGRLSLGHVSLAKQRKVSRLPGRDPADSARKISLQKQAAPPQKKRPLKPIKPSPTPAPQTKRCRCQSPRPKPRDSPSKAPRHRAAASGRARPMQPPTPPPPAPARCPR